MSMSIQGNTTVACSALKTAQLKTQVTLSGPEGSVNAALDKKQNGNIAGKLNGLEHSQSPNLKPMYLKGVLQKLTGVQPRDLDIDQFELVRTSLSGETSQATVTEGGGTAAEIMQFQAREMNLAVTGTLETRSGAEIGFTLQIDSAKAAAVYAAIAHQAVVTAEPAAPATGQTDEATQPIAQEPIDATA